MIRSAFDVQRGLEPLVKPLVALAPFPRGSQRSVERWPGGDLDCSASCVDTSSFATLSAGGHQSPETAHGACAARLHSRTETGFVVMKSTSFLALL